MALSKQKKIDVVEQTSQLLQASRLTAVASYSGTSVSALQDLRHRAKPTGTTVRIIKNRLVKKAMERTESLKASDTDFLTGQLMYCFNSEDEVMPAQILAKFAADEPQIKFVAGIASDGSILTAKEMSRLAALPAKDQLRAQTAALISYPLIGFMTVLSGNVRGVLNALSARASQLKS